MAKKESDMLKAVFGQGRVKQPAADTARLKDDIEWDKLERKDAIGERDRVKGELAASVAFDPDSRLLNSTKVRAQKQGELATEESRIAKKATTIAARADTLKTARQRLAALKKP